MITYQDLNPRGLIIPSNFGGITYRTLVTIEDDMPDDTIRHILFNGNNGDCYRHFWNWKDEGGNPVAVNMSLFSNQAKAAGIKFVVNNSTHTIYNRAHGSGSMPVELFARISGHIADLMEEQGWTDKDAAIALFNEPGKSENCGQGIEGAKKYVEYAKRSSDYIRGRFPIWLVNDEYHLIDEEYIFTHTTDIPKRVFGVHHLSSLGETPAWKHVEYAATQAATWGVPVICSEGGSWFKPYRSSEGHAVNVKLLEECARFNYDACAIVCNVNNEYTIANTWGTLGYLIYNNDYTALSRTDLTKWNLFNAELKLYKEEEELMAYLRPIVQENFYKAMGWDTKPYHENTPSLPIVGRKDENKALTWADFDAVIETLTKGLVKAFKDSGALPADFAAPMDIKYNADGSWNIAWKDVAKSNPE